MKTVQLLLDSGLELLFPTRCPFCGRLAEGRLPCCECEKEVNACRHEPPLLQWSKHNFYAISKAYSAFRYREPVNLSILKAKNGNPWYVRELTDLLAMEVFGYRREQRFCAADYVETVPLSLGYDCIVPVPDSGNGRGYWVTGLMADRLGQITGIPVNKRSLKKIRKTKRQAGLNREERLRNLIGAFGVDKAGSIEGKRVLLVDDIITTGATVSCCAVALLKAGAAEVTAVSFATPEME